MLISFYIIVKKDKTENISDLLRSLFTISETFYKWMLLIGANWMGSIWKQRYDWLISHILKY